MAACTESVSEICISIRPELLLLVIAGLPDKER